MSYDINFWRYKPGISLDHQEVYELLSDGKRVEGLEDLPIREMLARLESQFADWERLGERNFEGGNRGAFEIFTTPQFLRVDCYGMSGDDMNQIIDIANEFGCPLFDPQVGKRFDSG